MLPEKGQRGVIKLTTMKKLLLLTLSACLIFTVNIYTQDWTETASAPDGGGITDLLYRESNGDLFAVTGSFNWPSGEDGGIRRSSDEGDTWTNLIDTYTGRAIIEGADGELLASLWPYPQDEAVYRSTDNGDNWQQLVSVPSGNNIFSIAIFPGNPNIIYAGTRSGVMRSLDNGNTWNYSNNGMPGDSWVRGLDVDPSGVVAAGTTNGLYVSFDNGGNWNKVTGAGENDTIVSVFFDQVPGTEDEETRLYGGTSQGALIVTTTLVLYAVATLVYNFGPGYEITRIRALRLTTALVAYYMVSMYAALGGDFFMAMTGTSLWYQVLNGLPPNPLVSIFTANVVATTGILMFVGMYGNNANGAKVYKRTTSAISGSEDMPYNTNQGYYLHQNAPNPFSRETKIDFDLPENGNTTIRLYDLSGKEIKTLVDDYLNSGSHSIKLSKDGLPCGMYYYILTAKNYTETKKLVVN